MHNVQNADNTTQKTQMSALRIGLMTNPFVSKQFYVNNEWRYSLQRKFLIMQKYLQTIF